LGEIDLVMEDRETLVFVEVRYRNTLRFGGPIESVDHRKRKKLRATAQYFLQTHRRLADRPCRFDVVAVVPGEGESGIQWVPNAFGGT
jgi:putative endonuclease